ncbi:hypothetical protein CAI21_10065 [Alkalilimnicola ehrlichii]|uniref:Gluconate 2-dehydrogenase subunit 3 family protein n=1 Tax=Alkalilimnicola ehrlichii TaxID=351052 RepID=A0A3E0WX00_9GAMM|nr:gluconate 2-dehydrogenase subunit 3 family protein [Alkalilimnicola ehrlichii]RFA29396.1 hypothetical protein CAI21_10065 [Alkalilimnicola ehrlichii]RFA36909.1 hypothetical protein CAL65_10395 [Alkalilimnicola ehrlichii]
MTTKQAPASPVWMLRRRSLLHTLVALPILASSAPVLASSLGGQPKPPFTRLYPSGSSSRQQPAVDFDAAEIAILTHLIETILPSDDTPGAREAGTVDYVVENLRERGAEVVAGIKQGLAALDQMAQRQFEVAFVELEAAQANTILQIVASTPALESFWGAVRGLSVSHFLPRQPATNRSACLAQASITAVFPTPTHWIA